VKKCSRSIHSAQAELNITPLLDLAFVLLVIFILTTTPIVSDFPVALPTASSRPKEPPRKASSINIEPGGRLSVNSRQIDPSDLARLLIELRQNDPDLSVIVRGDAQTPCKLIRHALDSCQKAGIAKVELATEPAAARP
jgi:biopolymer transport protein ExbD